MRARSYFITVWVLLLPRPATALDRHRFFKRRLAPWSCTDSFPSFDIVVFPHVLSYISFHSIKAINSNPSLCSRMGPLNFSAYLLDVSQIILRFLLKDQVCFLCGAIMLTGRPLTGSTTSRLPPTFQIFP